MTAIDTRDSGMASCTSGDFSPGATPDVLPEIDHSLVSECPSCRRADQIGRLLESSPKGLVRCEICGLAWITPQPSDDELAAIYDADYFRTFGFREGNDEYHHLRRENHRRLLDRLEQRMRPGRLLDVGSGLGDLLIVAKERGWRVRGLEVNQFAVDHANARSPGSTECATLDEFHGRPDAFDLITCLDVLEHLRRPDVALNRMRDLLCPGGWLVITTINIASWSARLLGRHWPHFHRDHLWYFTPTSLRQLVTAAGLEVMNCHTPRKVFSASYLLGIVAEHARLRAIHRIAMEFLRRLPSHWLAAKLPPLPEGLMVLARRPKLDDSERPADNSHPLRE